jgi:hypothetical protein
LGKAEEAKKELATIRKSWGAGNQTIEEGYRRVDFELRVMKADRDLMRFIKELDRGYVPEGGVVPEDEKGRSSKQAMEDNRRAMMERLSSRRSLTGEMGKQHSARRLLQETEKPKSKRNLILDIDRKMSSRDLMAGAKQKSSRILMTSGHRKQLRRNSMTASGQRQQSSRRLDARGDRPSSNKRLGGERAEDEQRRAMMRKDKPRSSRDLPRSKNGLQ